MEAITTTDPSIGDFAADRSSVFRNGRISSINAWLIHAFDRCINAVSRRHEQHAFADVDAGAELEVQRSRLA